MNISDNTILITGGTAGIGLEFAKALSANNRTIVTGRDEARLRAAIAGLPNIIGIRSDVSDAADVDALVSTLYRDHPGLNIVINNAGKIASAYQLTGDGVDAFAKAGEEMLTNYLSVIRLNEKLLPLLKRQQQAAIVNVSSILAIAPGGRVGTYSASKAALHSYSITLRQHLSKSNVKVFEIYPPLVNTGFSADFGGAKGIAPAIVAAELLKGLKDNIYDIRVGNTAEFYKYFLASPEAAIRSIGGLEA